MRILSSKFIFWGTFRYWRPFFFTEDFCKIFSGTLFYKFTVTPGLKCTWPFDWPRNRVWGFEDFFWGFCPQSHFFLSSFERGLAISLNFQANYWVHFQQYMRADASLWSCRSKDLEVWRLTKIYGTSAITLWHTKMKKTCPELRRRSGPTGYYFKLAAIMWCRVKGRARKWF